MVTWGAEPKTTPSHTAVQNDLLGQGHAVVGATDTAKAVAVRSHPGNRLTCKLRQTLRGFERSHRSMRGQCDIMNVHT